jgi:putative transposase
MRPVFPRRRNSRLHGYHYSSEGLYFVTICTHLRQPIFGEIVGGSMHLNQAGKAVEETWDRMFRSSEEADTWIVMPNHLHGIVTITNAGDPGTTSRRNPLGRLIAAFKAKSKKRINEIRQTGREIWQRNFYEHVIGSERAFARIAAYIHDNPMRWEDDPPPWRNGCRSLRRAAHLHRDQLIE